MNRREQPQWTVSGRVEAPVEHVWNALLSETSVLPDKVKAALAQRNGSTHFHTTVGQPGEGRINVEIDHREHSIAIQGEWWYRGVYSVEPNGHGSRVVYRVYNVAPGIGWWAAQWVQGAEHARKMQAHLQTVLENIGERLRCHAQVGTG